MIACKGFYNIDSPAGRLSYRKRGSTMRKIVFKLLISLFVAMILLAIAGSVIQNEYAVIAVKTIAFTVTMSAYNNFFDSLRSRKTKDFDNE